MDVYLFPQKGDRQPHRFPHHRIKTLSYGLNTIVCRLRVSASEILFGMTDINQALGRVLARYRAIAKISQEELADRAGIHRTYVSQIERGLKSPTLSVLLKIYNVYRSCPKTEHCHLRKPFQLQKALQFLL